VTTSVCGSIYYNSYETYKPLGVHIEYLPPYFPDLNPIEEAFSKIKSFLRRHQDYYQAEIGDGMLYDMYEIMEIITVDDAIGYFMHAGYF
jgi:hypothetical protein